MPRANVSGEVRFWVFAFDVREDAPTQCNGVLDRARRFEKLEGFDGERSKVCELGLLEAFPGEYKMFPGLRAVFASLVEVRPQHGVKRFQIFFSEPLFLRKPLSGNIRNLLAILFPGQHRGVEIVLEHGVVVDVDEAETSQGAPVVRPDPVTEVRAKGVRNAERLTVARIAVVADAFDVEDPQGVSRSVRVRRFKARQAEKHLQVAERLQVDPATAVEGRDSHRERDFREVARPRKDREHGEEPALPSRSHATPPEQVARAVARGRDVGSGVEVVEEHGRDERAMGGAIGVRESVAQGLELEVEACSVNPQGSVVVTAA